jgi:hypothetical protein
MLYRNPLVYCKGTPETKTHQTPTEERRTAVFRAENNAGEFFPGLRTWVLTLRVRCV